ncbi:MAG: SIS domain-containing protein [Elusimicrobiota bacterium]
MVYILQEIRQQPDAINNTIKREWTKVQKICARLQSKNINIIGLCARGTSDNAANLGRYLLEYVTGIPITLTMPSIYTLYKHPPRIGKNAIVIGISQSGETIEVCEVLKEVKKLGAIALAITNEPNSTLANVADEVILCHAGIERSVAATKTYTTQLTALYLLAGMFAKNESLLNQLRRAPLKITELFALETVIKQKIERYKYITDCIVLGRGFNYATALETALKLKETCYIPADPYSSADFMHGPVATVEQNLPVIIYAPNDPTLQGQRETVTKIRSRGAETIIVTSDNKLLRQAQWPIEVPKDIPFIISPFTNIVVGQMLAAHLSLTKGYNPDAPRGLTKVTQATKSGI